MWVSRKYDNKSDESRTEGLSVSDTRKKVCEVIARQFGLAPGEIKDATTLDDLGADSMAVVELMVNLEEAFQAPMPDVSAANLNSVGDIIAFIDENRSSPAADGVREANA